MKTLNKSDFYFELIEEQTLIITIPKTFVLMDLEDMKIEHNSLIFKFNKELCSSKKIKNISKIKLDEEILNFISNYAKNKDENKIFIIDIKELEKQTKGIFYLYE